MNDKFNEINRLTEKSVLELDTLERKMMNNGRLRQLEEDNMELLSKITKLERDTHMAQAKIAELENTQTLNKKYLLDEELNRNIHLDENTKLNKELDGLSKLNEEILKEKVKESEERQILVIKNQQQNAEFKIGLLNEQKFKEQKLNEEKLKKQKYNNEKFKEVDRLTERSILELDSLERKMMNNGRIKQLEEDNMDLLSKITRLERDTHMAQAKIAELENTQTLNKK